MPTGYYLWVIPAGGYCADVAGPSPPVGTTAAEPLASSSLSNLAVIYLTSACASDDGLAASTTAACCAAHSRTGCQASVRFAS